MDENSVVVTAAPTLQREKIANDVAKALDEVVSRSVLVVGSPPPGGRDLDLLAMPSAYAAVTEWLSASGFVPWRHTWARFGSPGVYAVELTSAERWRTSRQDGSVLFVDADPIPGYRNLAGPCAASTIILAARGTVSRRGRITDKVRRRLKAALERDPDAWSVADERAGPLGMRAAVRLLRAAYDAPGTLPAPTRASAVARVLFSEGPLGSKLHLLAAARPKRVRPVIVSFSGLDGSGKSTQVDKLQDRLSQLGVSSDRQWAGFKSARKVRRMIWFLDGTAYKKDGTPLPRDPLVPSALLTNPVGRHAWVFIVVGVNALHLWRLALRRRPGTTILLFDRFTPDTTVKVDLHFLRSRAIDTRWERRLFTMISPKPDVGFFVDVPMDVAYGRRQEQTPEELRNMAELYSQQVQRYGLIRLDGTEGPDELAKRVALAAWQGLP